jgi:DNA-directed RNA polymerase subunit M/transcription elongation factor TFIIS
MATALQGAVIVSQDGTRISYKQKCDKCGNVSSSTTTTSVSSSSSSKTTSSFRCSKCGNQQKIEIQGG